MTPAVGRPDFVEHPEDPDLVAGLEVYDRGEWRGAEPHLRRAAERGNITAIFKLANVRDKLGTSRKRLLCGSWPATTGMTVRRTISG